MESPTILFLLNQVAALARTQEQMALLSGENFNVFRILGLESREVRTHSAFLGELLNPAGSHGLKDIFLKLFARMLDEKMLLEGRKPLRFDTGTAHLMVEYDIGRITSDYQQGGRIDIHLESGGEYIFIENKIYAGDQQNQLARYYAHQPNARLLYLTLHGSEPSEWSAGKLTDDQYQVVSYKKDIINWLENCRQAASAYPLVRETIVQYQHLINYLTGSTPKNFMMDETKRLLQDKQENFVSAAALAQAFEETRQVFFYFLKDKFEEEWKKRFDQNVSPLSDLTVHFRLQNNIYGFRAERNGQEVSVFAEEALLPLVEVVLALSGQRMKRPPKSWQGWDAWLGWKYMDKRYFDNLPVEELYQAATNEEVRKRLFEERFREVTPYFEQFQLEAKPQKQSAQ